MAKALTLAHRCALAACLALGLAACSSSDPDPGTTAPPATDPPAASAAPSITVQPASATIGQGLAATLAVQASQATAYQWQRSADGGAHWIDVAGATAARYTTAANQLADSGQQLRVRVTGDGGSVTSGAATLTVKPWVAGALATGGVVSAPNHMVLDASGANLYVAMGGSNSVRKIATADGSEAGSSAVTGFSAPYGLALAGDGTLYVSDSNRISKVAPGATAFTTWVGGTAGGYADSPATPLFSTPAGLALDGAGNLYVADLANFRVRKVAADGSVGTLAGDGTQAFLDGVGTAARFARPQGLALTGDGATLYDTDTDSPCLRRIDVASAAVSTVLGDCANGNAGAGTDDGTAATPAKLGYSYGVAVDAHGNVFLTHAWDGRVRVVTPGGEISTLRDAGGTPLGFNFPIGVAVAGDGTVYVGENGGNAITRLTLAP